MPALSKISTVLTSVIPLCVFLRRRDRGGRGEHRVFPRRAGQREHGQHERPGRPQQSAEPGQRRGLLLLQRQANLQLVDSLPKRPGQPLQTPPTTTSPHRIQAHRPRDPLARRLVHRSVAYQSRQGRAVNSVLYNGTSRLEEISLADAGSRRRILTTQLRR